MNDSNRHIMCINSEVNMKGRSESSEQTKREEMILSSKVYGEASDAETVAERGGQGGYMSSEVWFTCFM